MSSDRSRAQRLAQLQNALEEFVSEDRKPIVDWEHEKAKAKVRNRALKLLDYRARSASELSERLAAAEFDPALITETIADLEAAGLVDDRKFAEEWVIQRHQARGKSRQALDIELQGKGVSAEDRQAALEAIGQDSEEAKAREFARRKARSVKTVPTDWAEQQKVLARIVGVLARRGYPQSMSLWLAQEALDERISELG